jgi:ribosomal protein S18 acetylase RimI-like enzyme
MVTAQQIAKQKISDNIRPLDPRRDLGEVADLVELCFKDTLDPDGQDYIRQMRRAARNPMTGLAGSTVAGGPSQMGGFVWEEQSKIVGNLSLIPFYQRPQRLYLIANVAVQPAFRRRGIAYQLTAQAIEHARQRGAAFVWLQVRENNEAAIRLYQMLGFRERACRTTWIMDARTVNNKLGSPELLTPNQKPIIVKNRKALDWQFQRNWLKKTYPAELRWHLVLNMRALGPGFKGWLYRFFSGINVRQWSAYEDSRLMGVLAWNAYTGYTDHLWLCVDPHSESEVAYRLLVHACQKLKSKRTLSLDYPAGNARQAIESAGFVPRQTLIWMSLPL